MNAEKIIGSKFVLELAKCFDERQALDVTCGTTELDNANFRNSAVLGYGLAGDSFDQILNLIGDVGNHLDRFAEIVASSFLVDNALINLA